MDNNLILNPNDKPARADALQNRAKLLKIAHQLFNEYGVDEVSMTQIAKSAGVGQGTLYRHFANKIELCHALLDTTQRELQEHTFAYLKQTCDADEKLRWFLEQTATYVIDNLDLLSAHEGAFGASHLGHPAHLWWRGTIHGLLAELGATNEQEYFTDTLYVLLDPLVLHFQYQHRHLSREDILSGINSVLDRLLT